MQYLGGHVSSACSKRSRARSSLEPPCVPTTRDQIGRMKSERERTYVALDKLAQVGVPDLEGDRVREEVDAALVDLRDASESAAPFGENQDSRHAANGSTALGQLQKADAP